MRSLHLALSASLLAWTSASAVDVVLDARALGDAVALGQTRVERQLERFHAGYRVEIAQPPIDYIEVVTPFRRVVLAAETRSRLGDRSFGQRHAREALESYGDTVDLRVEITFHPLHTFVLVPDYEVWLLPPSGARIASRTIARVPRHGPRFDGVPVLEPAAPPASDQPMLGATIVAGFDGTQLQEAGRYTVLIEEGGEALAKTAIDFRRMR